MKIIAGDVLKSFQNEGIHKSYSLAFSVRSGSTVIANTLSTFGLGEPAEYFQHPYTSNNWFQKVSAPSLLDSFRQLVLAHLQNGIFGSKMTHDHRAHLDGQLRNHLDGYKSLDDVLPGHKWIFLRRRDTIAQAISWHVAQTTDRWHMPSGNGEFVHDSVAYDFFSILSKLMIIGANEVNWRAYFGLMAIPYLEIVFEDLAADLDAGFSSILKFMDIERSVSGVVLEREGGLESIAKKSKSTYESLTSRFTDDFMKLGEMDDAVRLGPSLEKWNDFFFKSQWRMS
jgi:trehalose 2-sulfotransferase